MRISQHALATPRLTVEASVTPVGAGLFKLSARVQNVGGLATNVREMAIAMKAAPPIEVRLGGDVRIL